MVNGVEAFHCDIVLRYDPSGTHDGHDRGDKCDGEA